MVDEPSSELYLLTQPNQVETRPDRQHLLGAPARTAPPVRQISFNKNDFDEVEFEPPTDS